jgi:hypothetical protein
MFGIGFEAYTVDGASVPDNDWPIGGNIEGAVGFEGNGFGVQFDILGSLYDPPTDDNDWTQGYLTGAVHAYARPGGVLVGAFGGGGFSEAEDSDEEKTFWFAGLETLLSGPAGTLWIAQGGYLDGQDEYDEGLNEAGFARLGLRAFANPNTAFLAAVSGAFGQQNDGDVSLANLELEAEQAFGSFSVFAAYEGTMIWSDGGDDRSDFHAGMVGLRFRPGASDLQTAYSAPGGLDLPSLGKWFSYTANEVE